MNEPNKPIVRNFKHVENLHIGENHTAGENTNANPPKYDVKYVINIKKVEKVEAQKEPEGQRATETYSPEELAEYQAYMANLKANEPKHHKAKWCK